MNALGAEQIADRLDDRFQLLTQSHRTSLAHHQTLRALVEWSYGMLDDRERRLFDRLSVFAGGFTLEAAETVCTGDAVAELVARLVDKSLVTTESAGADGRYRMLETLRAFAAERCRERGDATAVRDRHGAYFLSLAGTSGAVMRGRKQPARLERLETEHDNLRAALE